MQKQIEFDNTIKENDQVVFYESVNSLKLSIIKQNGFFQNKTGHFEHNKIIGQQYGSKIYNNKNNGYVYVLRPDPVLITDSILHKTQILYQADISMVLSKLNIQPGCIVVESGTGSASLSSSIARSLQQSGYLYTFEFNEERAKNGQQVLENQKLKNFQVIWRDVISNGFLSKEGDSYKLEKNQVDAVFLDLPRPSEAICHAVQVLKKGGRLCCFSPCIESVQKNCEEMRKYQFIQIETIEVLQRHFYQRQKQFKSAFAAFPDKNINTKRKGAELNENIDEKSEQSQSENEDKNDNNSQQNSNQQNEDNQKNIENKSIQNTILYSSGPPEIKGHTGYLTFGILY